MTHLTPALARELTALFSDAHLEVIAATGHYPQHDQAERVAELTKRAI